jgi:hypothetical protein
MGITDPDPWDCPLYHDSLKETFGNRRNWEYYKAAIDDRVFMTWMHWLRGVM